MSDMSIEVVTNIEGLEELEEAFNEGSKRAVKKFLRSAEMKAAKPLVESAKQNAPYESGQLMGDIHRQSVVDESAGTLTVRVGPSKETFWGLIQEFGSPEANVPALHWLEQSAVDVQDQVLEGYSEALTEGLEDMKRKA
jgi:HK97 gp10 family phage protein